MGAQVTYFVYDTANATATQIVTNSSGVYQINLINADVYPGDPVQNAIIAGTNSYERWIRLNVVSWAGSSSLSNIRVYISSGTVSANTAFLFGSTPTYAAPTNSNSIIQTTPLPTQLPSSANWSIGGSLSGSAQLVSQSGSTYSDYGVFQLQTSPSATAGSSLTVSVVYSEVS